MVVLASVDHKSWITQRLANRLPQWSDARRQGHSVFQQFVNPIGKSLEDLFKFVIDENNNNYLMKANLDLLDIAYVVRLPENYSFTRDQNDLSGDQYAVPRVVGELDGVDIEVSITSANTIEDFYYASLPTRVTDTGTYATVIPIIDDTILDNLDSATIISLPVDENGDTICLRLVITISGCENFIDTSRRMPSSFVTIDGTTFTGATDTETVYINYNGVFLTHKIWKTVTSVQYYGLQPSDSGQIRIDAFHFNMARDVDKYALVVDMDTEKLLYHKVLDHSFNASEPSYSIHQHMVVQANSLSALYNGTDTLVDVKEIELGWDNSGTFTNVQLVDIAVQPFTGRIFGLDATHLYIFDPYDSQMDYTGMKERTSGASMIIDTDFPDSLRGETITFDSVWRSPTKRIYKNRWTVKRPDGTRFRLAVDGTEIAYGNEAWIYNNTYTELVFGPFTTLGGEDINKQSFSLELTQRGTWQIMLEVVFVDGTTETDILPVQAHYKTALARLALPVGLQNPTGLAFDADQKLWLVRGSGNIAHKLSLATDNMLINFKDKIVYLHEEYDIVTVYPTDDWID